MRLFAFNKHPVLHYSDRPATFVLATSTTYTIYLHAPYSQRLLSQTHPRSAGEQDLN